MNADTHGAHGSESDAPLTDVVRAALATPERRIEGELKVTGAARYTADVQRPGMLWAAYLTSPQPHARILSIDTAAARALPGVHAVLTGADLGGARMGRRLMDWPVLAYERVRFVGERVAAIAAESRAVAEAAARLVRVDYEELPALLEPDQALAPDAPPLHPHAADYRYVGGTRPSVSHPNLQGEMVVRRADEGLEQAFAGAARVFEHTFRTPRQHHGYIEPHAAVVWLDGDTVHVASTNKAPFSLRQQMAATFGLPAEQIVIDSAFIGGDFGGKGLSLDEFTCYVLARATGRPVKAVMSYVDELQGTNPRHPATIHLRTGVDAQGRFVAHEARVVLDGGAYAAAKPLPALVVSGAIATLTGYRVPHARITVQTAYTNSVPSGHMRAPGEVQALFAGESHVDMIARELGMDPLELRLLNAVREGEANSANQRFREPRAVEVLETLRRETGWRQTPLPPGVGRGVALGARHVGGGKTAVRLRLAADGHVELLTGVPDQGAGAHTVARRIAATALGVDPARVRVVYGTTSEAPQDPGAGGSRVTHILGQAARRGGAALRARLEELAAEVMGWPAGQVHLRGDRFVVGNGVVGDGTGGEGAPFAEVAARLTRGAAIEVQGAYDDTGHHGPDDPGDYNFAAYLAEVAVDPETGAIRVRDVVLVADVGTIVNPVAHQGQLEGGFVSGLGAALLEDLPVEDGKVTALSLGEYKLPAQVDLPPLRTLLLPTPVGPGAYGAKMAGEVSNTGVAPAIANAVADAVGARVTSLPLSAERVLAALRDAGNGARPHPDDAPAEV